MNHYKAIKWFLIANYSHNFQVIISERDITSTDADKKIKLLKTRTCKRHRKAKTSVT